MKCYQICVLTYWQCRIFFRIKMSSCSHYLDPTFGSILTTTPLTPHVPCLSTSSSFTYCFHCSCWVQIHPQSINMYKPSHVVPPVNTQHAFTLHNSCIEIFDILFRHVSHTSFPKSAVYSDCFSHIKKITEVRKR